MSTMTKQVCFSFGWNTWITYTRYYVQLLLVMFLILIFFNLI